MAACAWIQLTACVCVCVCRFYIGCDQCSNWLHGECVGITELQASTMPSYTCPDCLKPDKNIADENGSDDKLYCVCRTPYNASLWVYSLKPRVVSYEMYHGVYSMPNTMVYVACFFADSTSDVTSVRTGTTEAVWASQRRRQPASSPTCVSGVSSNRLSRQRTQEEHWTSWCLKITTTNTSNACLETSRYVRFAVWSKSKLLRNCFNVNLAKNFDVVVRGL